MPGSIFIATHPYADSPDYLSEDLERLSGGLLQRLTAKIYPQEKSWYHPEATSLILIGGDDILDLLLTEGLNEPLQIITGSYVGHNL